MLKVEEKLLDLKEQQRVDRNDYNNKLATFKVDMSMISFDKPTF